MKHCRLTTLLALLAMTAGLRAETTVWDGSTDTSWFVETEAGTAFTLTTAEQLAGLAALVAEGQTFEGDTVLLANDVTLNDIMNPSWLEWDVTPPANVWTPIGTYDNNFQGFFNGQGHAIHGLFVGGEGMYGGFFNFLGEKGTVTRLHLASGQILSSDKAAASRGGIVCVNAGTVSYCSNAVQMKHVGACAKGGIVGVNNGDVFSCYNYREITTNPGAPCGAIIGITNANYTDCAYLEGSAEGGVAGSVSNDDAASFTKTEFQDGTVCWHLNGDGVGVWGQGLKFPDKDYLPVINGATVYEGMSEFTNQRGQCTDALPTNEEGDFLLTTLDHYKAFSEATTTEGINFSGQTIKLTADINLNDTTGWHDWSLENNPENGYTPIAYNEDFAFKGTFDGQGHSLNGLCILNPTSTIAVFGTNEGIIRDLRLQAFYLNGQMNAGLTIMNAGTIDGCRMEGRLVGTGMTSGFSIQNSGNITNCCFIGERELYDVEKGAQSGLVCYNEGKMESCYFVGSLPGGMMKAAVVLLYNETDLSRNYYLAGMDAGLGVGVSFAEMEIVAGDMSKFSKYTCNIPGRAEALTAEQFANGELCWRLNSEQPEGAWGQNLGTDPYPVYGGPAVYRSGAGGYTNTKPSALDGTAAEASFRIFAHDGTLHIVGSEAEACIYTATGSKIYQGTARSITLPAAGLYIVRIGNEVQKAIGN